MEKRQILEENRLIAEFMGVMIDKNILYPSYGQIPEQYHSGGILLIEDLKYHCSWDWLMPVVEKIQTDFSRECGFKESSRHRWGWCAYFSDYKKQGKTVYYFWSDYKELEKAIEAEKKDCEEWGDEYVPGPRYIVSSKIEAVWLAVVEFVKWYNREHN